MVWRTTLMCGLLFLTATGTSSAQPRLLPVPMFVPPGAGLPRARVVIGAYRNPYVGQLLIPAGFIGYSYPHVEPPLVVQVISPPRRSAPPVDLSGVDLDVAPPPWASDRERPKHDRAPMPPPKPQEAAKRREPAGEPPPRPMPAEAPEPKLPPREEGTRLVALGLGAFRSQDYGLAARRFRQALEVDPAGSRAYFLLGQAHFALSKYADAVQMIGLGLGLEPSWPTSAFRPRFDLYVDHPEDWQAHLDALLDAQARQPKNAGLLFLLAHQRWFDDQRDEATRLFRQVRPLVSDPALVDLFLKADTP